MNRATRLLTYVTAACLGLQLWSSEVEARTLKDEAALSEIERATKELAVISRQDAPFEWAEKSSALCHLYIGVSPSAETLTKAIERCDPAAYMFLEQIPKPHRNDLFSRTLLDEAYAYRLRSNYEYPGHKRAFDLDQASHCFFLALLFISEAEQPMVWASAQRDRAAVLMQFADAGHNEKAMSASIAAIKEFEKIGDKRATALEYEDLGIILLSRIAGTRLDNIESAIGAFKRSEAFIEPDVNFKDWVDLENNLSIAFFHRIKGNRAENVDISVSYLEEVLKAVRTRPDRYGQVPVSINLANAYINKISGSKAENIDRAINLLEDALNTSKIGNYDREVVQLALGSAYANRIYGNRYQNLDKAIALNQSIVDDASPESLIWANAQQNLGMDYARRTIGEALSNSQLSVKALDAAASYFAHSGRRVDWARAQAGLGMAWGLRTDEASEKRAVDDYQSALAAFPRSEGPIEWATLQQGFSDALWKVNTRIQNDNIGKSVAAGKAALSVFTVSSFPRNHMQSSWSLAQKLMTLGDMQGARAAASDAISAADFLIGAGLDEAATKDVLASIQGAFALSAHILAKEGDLEHAFETFDHGRARLLQAELLAPKFHLSDDEMQRLSSLRSQIHMSDRLLELGAPMSQNEMKRLSDNRAAAAALYLKGAQTEVKEDSATALSSKRVLVAPILTPFGSEILIGNNGLFQSFQLSKNTQSTVIAEDEDWLNHYRMGDYEKATDRLSEGNSFTLGADIYQALKKAKIADNAPVSILIDARTSLLPLSLATDPESHHHLIDDYEISVIVSLRSLSSSIEKRAAAAGRTVGIVSGANSRLTGAALERAFVASFFKRGEVALIETQMAKSSADVLRQLSNFSYWDFATHASFDWDAPMSSSLQLTTSMDLKLRDILEYPDLVGPRLVVLAACETALTDIGRNPDEFTGLPIGFLQAGAGGVVASLWPVDDLATAFLIGRFYELAIGEHQRPAQALRHAQLWLRQATSGDLRRVLLEKIAHGWLSARESSEPLQRLENIGSDSAVPFAKAIFWAPFQLYGD